MDYDASVWGPHYWFFLDTIAMIYPTYPNDVVKKKYYNLIQNLPLFIPNYEISRNFEKILDLYPLKPYLDNKKSLIKWMNKVHNVINEKLEKPQMSLDSHYIHYYNRYGKIPNKTFGKYRKYVTFFIVISCLAMGCIYLYNK